jgi:hypothetical protein
MSIGRINIDKEKDRDAGSLSILSIIDNNI